MTKSTKLSVLLSALVLGVVGTGQRVPAETSTSPKPCTPTSGRVGKSTQVTPASQDVKYGQCLFNSTIDFNQSDPQSLFGSPISKTPNLRHPISEIRSPKS